MAGWSDVLDALADNIRDVIGDIDWEIQVEPWMVLNPTTPTIDMFPSDPPTDDQTIGFGQVEGFKSVAVRLRVAGADADARRDVILSLMDLEDDHSVVAAATDDQTLNGLASQIWLSASTGLSAFPRLDGPGAYMGVQWTFGIMDNRS